MSEQPGKQILELVCGRCDQPYSIEQVAMHLGSGPPLLVPPPPAACFDCLQAERTAEEVEQLAKRKAARLENVRRVMPPEFQPATVYELDSGLVQRPELRDLLTKWDGVPWLFLYGGVGTGKSYCCAAAANWHMEHGTFGSLAWVNVPDLIIDVMESIGKRDRRRRYDLDEIMRADLCVLDEIGAENPTPFARQQVYAIVNHRSERGKPTLITSNLDLDQIGHATGQRVASRLALRCRQIHVGGPDLRPLLAERAATA